MHKGGDGRIEDKIFIEDNIVENCLSYSVALCQQDLRKHQNESKRIRLELDKLIRRQAEIEEEYAAVSRKLAVYKQACQEQTAAEPEAQMEFLLSDSRQQALQAEEVSGVNQQSADSALLIEQRSNLENLRIACQETRAVITKNLVRRDEITACLTGLAESGALTKQNKKIQEEIIDLETQLNYLDMEKQKLAKAMALLVSQKPEAYQLLSGSREEQIATVAQYSQYLMDFSETARDIESQQQVPVAAFLNQDISLLLDKVGILKQRQFDLKYPEMATIDQVRELSLALEDMAQDYGWETSQLKTEPQNVTVTAQNVRQLHQQANDLLVVAPPGLLARVGLCGQWKKTLFDLIVQAKSMEELAHSPEALRQQITTGVEGVLLECHHLAQRIYEVCYKHLSACGRSIDQAYNKLEDELTAFSRQLLNSSKQAQQLRGSKNMTEFADELSLRQSLQTTEDTLQQAQEQLQRQEATIGEIQQLLQEQDAELMMSPDMLQSGEGNAGLLADGELQAKISKPDSGSRCLAASQEQAASVTAQLEKLADEKKNIILAIEEVTKQLEGSISPEMTARNSLVREWIGEIQQYRPENKQIITERMERARSRQRRGLATSEAVVQNVVAGQPGLLLLETSEWLLPVAVMDAEYILEGHREFTLIEKFAIKCIASGQPELSSLEGIAGLFHLEEELVAQQVNSLVQGCLLSEKQAGSDRSYDLSALGQEGCQAGRIAAVLQSGKVAVTVNAQYEWLAVWKQGAYSGDDTDCNLPVFRYCNKQEELELRNYYPADHQEVSQQVAEKIKEWYIVEQQEPVITVDAPQYQRDVNVRLAEFWLYDLVQNQIVCRVWSFAQQEFCAKLEFALTALEGRQRLEQVQAACNNSKSWTDLTAKLRSQVDIGFLPLITEDQVGADKHNVLLQAIDDTRELLLLLVPDYAEIAADAEIIKRLRSAVNRGCRIFIGWGKAQSMEAEQQLPPAGVNEKLQNILDSENFPGIFTLYVGKQTTKTALVDDQELLTWLPDLSCQGRPLMQKQVVAKVADKSDILEQQLMLQGVFLKQLERQLLQDQSADPLRCITWFYAVLTLTNHGYIREILAEEALAKAMDTHAEQTLFMLLAVYVKANQYEFGFSLLLKRLAASETGYTKLTYWLDKLRTRNSKAYKKVMPIFKTIRKRK